MKFIKGYLKLDMYNNKHTAIQNRQPYRPVRWVLLWNTKYLYALNKSSMINFSVSYSPLHFLLELNLYLKIF